MAQSRTPSIVEFADKASIYGSRALDETLSVAHVSPAYFSDQSLIGGGERYVSYVIRALESVRPQLPFALSQAVFAIGSQPLRFEDGGVPVTVLPNEGGSSSPMAALSGALWEALAPYDVIHLHQALTLFGAFVLSVGRSLGKTVIVTDLGGGEDGLLMQHGGLRLADGLLAISDFARSLTKHCFDGATEVVLGPVDTELFSPPSEVPERRSAISVGRLLPHKGFDRIIDALPEHLNLTIVGRPYDPGYFRDLQKRAEGKRVTFVTDADDAALRAAYREATLYVHASTFLDLYGRRVAKPELMGLTTLEALSSGLAVAVANVASLPELAQDERFGRVFGSEAELRSILTDHWIGVWPEPGSHALARELAVRAYSFEAAGRRIAAFYDRVHSARLKSKPV